MQTQLADFIRDTPAGREADSILRSCVHCGFCTATCPTYQLLGDELDGPRGRIYLIKSVLEGETPTEKTQLHLDRCLTCRSCETTCPSGVVYHRLLDIGREEVEKQVRRPLPQRLMRRLLLTVMPRRWLFTPLLRIGQMARPLLPAALRDKTPARRQADRRRPSGIHQRKVILPEGCVQPALAPGTNAAAARVLDRLGIEVVSVARETCCGALRHHLNAGEAAAADMRRNIDAWWPAVEAGAEAIVSTASGCAAHLNDYGKLLADDDYAQRAARVARLTLDISQLLVREEDALRARLEQVNDDGARRRVVFQSPCTLQHGLGITGSVERLLTAAGYDLLPAADSHLCCGS
ncbi:MAG: glycolate oxidase subunit GlcF, partial [Porticoccaceae bacterium]